MDCGEDGPAKFGSIDGPPAITMSALSADEFNFVCSLEARAAFLFWPGSGAAHFKRYVRPGATGLRFDCSGFKGMA